MTATKTKRPLDGSTDKELTERRRSLAEDLRQLRSSPAKFVDAIHEYIDAAVEAAREHYAQVVYGAVARISRVELMSDRCFKSPRRSRANTTRPRSLPTCTPLSTLRHKIPPSGRTSVSRH